MRRDIAWKVACGLRLGDEGFHPTVLVYWRNRIRRSTRPRRIFDAVCQVVQATGVLRGRGRRVLDSTILADAVATQDTVTQLVAAIRGVRRLLGQARGVELTAHDYERAGKPDCAWDDPQATHALVSGLVNDALAVLAAVGDVGLDDEQAEAVALLALVAGQDVEPGTRPGSWRIARQVARDRVISTVDPQARHSRKTAAAKCDGYKGHIAVEPESGLVTECALTAANVPDGPAGVGLLAAEQPGLEVLADSAYGGGRTRAALRAAGHTQTIKPLPLHSAIPGGFTIHDFRIDRSAGILRCPGGRDGADHQLRPGQLHTRVSLLPAASTLHHRQTGPHHPPPPARRRAARRPPPCDQPKLPAKLPALAADGGTLHRLAGRRWLPAGALPWDRTQRPVVVGPSGRGEPPSAAGAWPCSSGPELGPGLTGTGIIRARLHLAQRSRRRVPG